VVISVPTPIDSEGRPYEVPVERACETVLQYVSDGALIVMQCTVVPGSTRRLLVDPLNAAGRKVGEVLRLDPTPMGYDMVVMKDLRPGKRGQKIGRTIQFLPIKFQRIHRSQLISKTQTRVGFAMCGGHVKWSVRMPRQPFAVGKKFALKQYLAGFHVDMRDVLIILRKRQQRLFRMKCQRQILRGDAAESFHFTAIGPIPQRYSFVRASGGKPASISAETETLHEPLMCAPTA